jgi:Yip1 domain
MNNIALAVSLATEPTKAFGELRDRPRFWFPLLVMVLSTVAVAYWYYNIVDVDWLKDLIISSNPKMTEQERAAVTGMMTRTTMLWSGVVGSIIIIPLFYVIHAVVLLLTAKITKVSLGFKHWFAMVSWTSLAGLLNIVIGAIFLLLSDNSQVSPGVMAPLSLNELLLHRPIGSPGQGLLDMLSIPSLLTWALMIVGVRTWSQRSWGFSAAFVLVPLGVICAIWAFIAFR